MLATCMLFSAIASAEVDYNARLDQVQALVDDSLPVYDKTSRAYLNGEFAAADMAESYPLIHEDLLPVMEEFLQLKREDGSTVERQLYANMDLIGLVDRLFTKRPLAFYNPADQHVLRDGHKKLYPNYYFFDTVGSDNETAPYLLANYLSYDEMLLAAMCGVSGPTSFRNDGDRKNRGVEAAKGTFQERGVYVGLVGARFERRGLMESVFMQVNHQINNTQSAHPAWKALGKFYNFTDGVVEWNSSLMADTLDLERYKKRIKLSYELFLLEADQRGRAAGNKTYCHLVGLGTGVWAVDGTAQETVIWDAVMELLAEHNFQHIGTVHFAWFSNLRVPATPDGTVHNGVRVLIGKRSPAAPLPAQYADQLLVASFPWDSNAFVGNEYWAGPQRMGDSGDPAAVASSTIGLTQNPLVNIEYISGANARVLFRDGTSAKLADVVGRESKWFGLFTDTMIIGVVVGTAVLLGILVVVALLLCRSDKSTAEGVDQGDEESQPPRTSTS